MQCKPCTAQQCSGGHRHGTIQMSLASMIKKHRKCIEDMSVPLSGLSWQV